MNHYLYLGPKYSKAINAFNSFINGEIVKIPCDEEFIYTEGQVEHKNKSKSQIKAANRKDVINKRTKINNLDADIKKINFLIGDSENKKELLSISRDQKIEKLSRAFGGYSLSNGDSGWIDFKYGKLLRFRDSIYSEIRLLQTVRKKLKYKRNDTPIEMKGEGTYIWGGLLWDTDKIYDYCIENDYDYYWIDNAYLNTKLLLTNQVIGELGKKNISRHKTGIVKIIKNGFHASKLIERPNDRLEKLGLLGVGQQSIAKFKSNFLDGKKGRHILVCPPSDAYQKVFGYTNWLDETIKEIKKYTDITIKVREKKIRKAVPLVEDLKFAHCTVAPASGVSIESILAGIPTFCSDFSPAAPVGNLDLSKINEPWFPDAELIERWLSHLAYCQFSLDEIKDGTAWNILNS